MQLLSDEWKGVHEHHWNSERPLIFSVVGIWKHMKFAALVHLTETNAMAGSGGNYHPPNDDDMAWRYNAM